MSLSKHRCEVCNLSFTSSQHYSIHLGGLLHNEKQRRNLGAEGDFLQGPTNIMDGAEYPLSASDHRYSGINVDSILTGLHSYLKQAKSSVVSHETVLTSPPHSRLPSVTAASPQTASQRSSQLGSNSEFATSLNDSYYKDANWQRDNQDANGWESSRSQDVPWKEEQSFPRADNTTEAPATQKPASVTYGSKEKNAILNLLAAQRLLQEKRLGEESPKKPAKPEVKSKDSVRSLLSAQFDLLKSYMTEPQKPASAPEAGKVKADPGQDLSRQKAADWNDVGRSTAAGSAFIVRNRHSAEAERYSTDRSMGQQPQGSGKTPSDFWSRQATYADEAQSDLSSIPFLGDGCTKDEDLLEKPKASFLPHSLGDQVAAGAWGRKDDGSFSAGGQWDRSSERSVVNSTLADVSKGAGPNRSDVPSSNRTWQSQRHDTVMSDVPSNAWELHKSDGFEKAAERTYNDEQQYELKEDYHRPQFNEPLYSSENTWNRPAATGAYPQKVPGLMDEIRRPAVPPLVETKRSQSSSMEEFMAQVKHNLQRDLKFDSFPPRTSSSEVMSDFGKSYPLAAAPPQPPYNSYPPRKSSSEVKTDFGKSYPLAPAPAQPSYNLYPPRTSSLEVKTDFGKSYPLAPAPAQPPYNSYPPRTSSSEVKPDSRRSFPVGAAPLPPPLTQRKVLLETPTSDSKPSGTSVSASPASPVTKRKILLPTPVAEPAMTQSSTSLTSSSTGTNWSHPPVREGIPSQQQPRFGSSTLGGGRSVGSDSSADVRLPAKKTLLSTPPASCLQQGSYGNSSSNAGVVSSPLRAALPTKSSPLGRNSDADKSLVSSASSEKLETRPPLLPSPVMSSLTTNIPAAKPHPSIGKPPAVSGSANSETGEVDPQLKLQKEIEVVMAERVEDLMRAIPDSMMRSIMDGKIPLAFLDKISDLIPTEVIEEAVRQKEQSATSDHLKKGTSLTLLAGNQKTMVAAKPETAVTEGVKVGGEVELVKKMIDEILGDLANETGALANTEILEKLAPDDRSMVLEIQDAAGIRDVSVTIEILEFFKTLDRDLLLALSTIDEGEKGGQSVGGSVLKRMTKLMWNNRFKNDPSASRFTGTTSTNTPTTSTNTPTTSTNTPTYHSSQTIATKNAGPGSSVRPCVTTSSTAGVALQNRAVAPLISLSEKPQNAPPCRAVGLVEKPGYLVNRSGLLQTPEVGSSSVNRSGLLKTPEVGSSSVDRSGPLKTPEVGSSSVNRSGPLKTPEVGSSSVNRSGPLKTPEVGSSSVNRSGPLKMPEVGSSSVNRSGPLKMPEVGSSSVNRSGPFKTPEVGSSSVDRSGPLTMPEVGSSSVNRSGLLKTPEVGSSSVDRSGPLKTPEVGSSSVDRSGPLTMPEVGSSSVNRSGPWKTPEVGSSSVNRSGPWKTPEVGSSSVNRSGPLKTPEVGSSPVNRSALLKTPEVGSSSVNRSGLLKTPEVGSSSVNRSGLLKTPEVGSSSVNRSGALKTPEVGSSSVNRSGLLKTPEVGSSSVNRSGPLKTPEVGSSSVNCSALLKTPEVGSAFAINEKLTGSDKLGVRGSSDVALSKTQTIEMPVSNAVPSNVKAPSAHPLDKGTVGVKTVSNVPQTSGNKAAFGLRQNDGSGKTPPGAPQTKPDIAGVSFSNSSTTVVSSATASGKSELQGISSNRQIELMASKVSETRTVTSNLQNLTKRNEPSSAAISATTSVDENPLVGCTTANSKASTVSQIQKAGIAVAGESELKGTSEGHSVNRSGVLKMPEVGSSSAVNEKPTSSDKFGVSDCSGAALSKAQTIEMPESKTAQNNASGPGSRASVTPGVLQTRTAVAASSTAKATADAADTRTANSEPGAKSDDGQSVVDLTLEQPSIVDTQPADPLFKESAEKRKATEPLEPNKKAKLEAATTTSAVVSEKPAPIASSTVKATQSSASYVAPGVSTTMKGPRSQLTSPMTKPKITLLATPPVRPGPILPTPARPATILPTPVRPAPILPTPVRPAPILPTPVRPAPILPTPVRHAPILPTPVRPLLVSPHHDVRNTQPPSHVPFRPSHAPFRPSHAPFRPSHEPFPPSHAPFPPAQPRLPEEIISQVLTGLLGQVRPLLVPHERPILPANRIQPPFPHEARVGRWPTDEPFRGRDCAPMNLRPSLSNPSLDLRQSFMRASNSFRFPRPDLDNFGPPPFKRWR